VRAYILNHQPVSSSHGDDIRCEVVILFKPACGATPQSYRLPVIVYLKVTLMRRIETREVT